MKVKNGLYKIQIKRGKNTWVNMEQFLTPEDAKKYADKYYSDISGDSIKIVTC